MDHDEAPPIVRDETMLYRAPTPETDDKAVSDIWGRRLETRVVDTADVAGLLAEGWVRNPMDLADTPGGEGMERVVGKQEQATREALDTADKLLAEQERRIAELEAERDAVRDELKAASEAGVKLAQDLKAAEELADAETKAKEAALAELTELKAKTSKKG